MRSDFSEKREVKKQNWVENASDGSAVPRVLLRRQESQRQWYPWKGSPFISRGLAGPCSPEEQGFDVSTVVGPKGEAPGDRPRCRFSLEETST